MSSADAKPLPFIYQFAAGKSQLPALGEAPNATTPAGILLSSWDGSKAMPLHLGNARLLASFSRATMSEAHANYKQVPWLVCQK